MYLCHYALVYSGSVMIVINSGVVDYLVVEIIPLKIDYITLHW